MDSCLSQGYSCYVKCNHSRPGFELVSPCPFPTTITITPRAPPFDIIVKKTGPISYRMWDQLTNKVTKVHDEHLRAANPDLRDIPEADRTTGKATLAALGDSDTSYDADNEKIDFLRKWCQY